ncbi:hypothetical protein B0T14DRAFT_244209 [Immersiella caudata]|uniref:Uncharacterized protein n=1 Tax=Immersiella caudata TaxID=314043 RepID=A0AA39WJ12_9PEZI|nr:hypothetical protein B0T14DRAFT_244209 [Immersiella caudata]
MRPSVSTREPDLHPTQARMYCYFLPGHPAFHNSHQPPASFATLPLGLMHKAVSWPGPADLARPPPPISTEPELPDQRIISLPDLLDARHDNTYGRRPAGHDRRTNPLGITIGKPNPPSISSARPGPAVTANKVPNTPAPRAGQLRGPISDLAADHKRVILLGQRPRPRLHALRDHASC